ncbi:MAG: hypothetical protein JSR33_01565 [Proteobacteria bacterium]|nr:hypothetical protein [Pseudomonadota bacterium]
MSRRTTPTIEAQQIISDYQGQIQVWEKEQGNIEQLKTILIPLQDLPAEEQVKLLIDTEILLGAAHKTDEQFTQILLLLKSMFGDAQLFRLMEDPNTLEEIFTSKRKTSSFIQTLIAYAKNSKLSVEIKAELKTSELSQQEDQAIFDRLMNTQVTYRPALSGAYYSGAPIYSGNIFNFIKNENGAANFAAVMKVMSADSLVSAIAPSLWKHEQVLLLINKLQSFNKLELIFTAFEKLQLLNFVIDADFQKNLGIFLEAMSFDSTKLFKLFHNAYWFKQICKSENDQKIIAVFTQIQRYLTVDQMCDVVASEEFLKEIKSNKKIKFALIDKAINQYAETYGSTIETDRPAQQAYDKLMTMVLGSENIERYVISEEVDKLAEFIGAMSNKALMPALTQTNKIFWSPAILLRIGATLSQAYFKLFLRESNQLWFKNVDPCPVDPTARLAERYFSSTQPQDQKNADQINMDGFICNFQIISKILAKSDLMELIRHYKLLIYIAKNDHKDDSGKNFITAFDYLKKHFNPSEMVLMIRECPNFFNYVSGIESRYKVVIDILIDYAISYRKSESSENKSQIAFENLLTEDPYIPENNAFRFILRNRPEAVLPVINVLSSECSVQILLKPDLLKGLAMGLHMDLSVFLQALAPKVLVKILSNSVIFRETVLNPNTFRVVLKNIKSEDVVTIFTEPMLQALSYQDLIQILSVPNIFWELSSAHPDIFHLLIQPLSPDDLVQIISDPKLFWDVEKLLFVRPGLIVDGFREIPKRDRSWNSNIDLLWFRRNFPCLKKVLSKTDLRALLLTRDLLTELAQESKEYFGDLLATMFNVRDIIKMSGFLKERVDTCFENLRPKIQLLQKLLVYQDPEGALDVPEKKNEAKSEWDFPKKFADNIDQLATELTKPEDSKVEEIVEILTRKVSGGIDEFRNNINYFFELYHESSPLAGVTHKTLTAMAVVAILVHIDNKSPNATLILELAVRLVASISESPLPKYPRESEPALRKILIEYLAITTDKTWQSTECIELFTKFRWQYSLQQITDKQSNLLVEINLKNRGLLESVGKVGLFGSGNQNKSEAWQSALRATLG